MRYLYLFMMCLFFQNSFSQNLLWENVYPNPLVLGKMIAVDSEDKIISGNFIEQLNISDLSPGVYFVKVKNATKVQIIKFIKI